MVSELQSSPVLRNAIAAWYQQWYRGNWILNQYSTVIAARRHHAPLMTYLNPGDGVLIPNPVILRTEVRNHCRC